MRKSDDRKKKLEIENRELKKRVKELEKNKRNDKGVSSSKSDIKNPNESVDRNGISDIAAEIARDERLNSADSFYGYIFKAIKTSSLYRIYFRIRTYFRRIRLIRNIITVLGYILLLLETGTIIIVYAALLILLFPFALLLLAAVPFISFLRSGKSNKYMRDVIGERNVYVFFPLKNSGFENSAYFKKNVADFASDHDNLVVIVYPYFFKRLKSCKKIDINIFSDLSCDRILIIKKYYYFIFFKKVLRNMLSKVNLIY